MTEAKPFVMSKEKKEPQELLASSPAMSSTSRPALMEPVIYLSLLRKETKRVIFQNKDKIET